MIFEILTVVAEVFTVLDSEMDFDEDDDEFDDLDAAEKEEFKEYYESSEFNPLIDKLFNAELRQETVPNT